MKSYLIFGTLFLIVTLSQTACSSSKSDQQKTIIENDVAEEKGVEIKQYRFNVKEIEVYDMTGNSDEIIGGGANNIINQNLSYSDPDKYTKVVIRSWLRDKFASYGNIGKLKILVNVADTIEEKVRKDEIDKSIKAENKNYLPWQKKEDPEAKKIATSFKIRMILEIPVAKKSQIDDAINDIDELALKDEDLIAGEIRSINFVSDSTKTPSSNEGDKKFAANSVNAVVLTANSERKISDPVEENEEKYEEIILNVNADAETILQNVHDIAEIRQITHDNIDNAVKKLNQETANTLSNSLKWQDYIDLKY